MIYAVDFDGTIVDDNYPEIGKPRERLIHYLKFLKNQGHTLILWTCRVGKDLEAAINYCKELGIEFDYINENTKEHIAKFGGDTRKIFADYYIDDKAIRFRRLVGDQKCGEIDCDTCPLRCLDCRTCGEVNPTLYTKLREWLDKYGDKDIYYILHEKLNKEVE